MLSLKHHFLFIHIPKTAGNSIQQVLDKYADENIVAVKPWQDGVEDFEIVSKKYGTSKHSTLREYRKILGKLDYKSLYKFTVVRNPWDRAISTYFYTKKYRQPQENINRPNYSGEIKFSKEEFIEILDIVSPVTKWVCTDNRVLKLLKPHHNRLVKTDIDFFIRYENLNDDFNQVCERIGIPFENPGIRNKIDREYYSDYYDAETRDMVSRKFRDEIDYFGYEFEER